MSKQVRKAVLPVAGLGTRFLPVTKTIPKEMLPVLSKPLIQYAVEEALSAGIEEILFVHARGKESIEDYFDYAPDVEIRLQESGKKDVLEEIRAIVPEAGKYAFVRQLNPKGFGHAVLCARAWIGCEPFAVILPDDLVMSDTPAIAQMIEAYDISMGNMPALLNVPKEETNRYGIINPVSSGDHHKLIKAKGIVEKPHPDSTPSSLAVLGRYILHPEIFTALSNQQPGVGGEIQLTDALDAMIPAYGLTGMVIEGHRFDCGSVEGMVAAQVAFSLKEPKLASKVKLLINPWL
ncbi:MAG: UTP--glucose-1-phosphate uridylyltransferase [Alphaproteobacteria bacterium 43-37]|nr:MAG: UTP--glucose-1-phosphate uridylyltransferase [Alphaproteobacteria bacterium 43-37]